MGGSSNPSPGNGSNAASNGEDGELGGASCAIQFKAKIHGPVPGRATSLSMGDVLRVERIEGPPEQLGLFDTSGERVGSLAGHRELTRLLNCIRDGHKYVAEVGLIEGSIITVQVGNA